MTQGAALIFLTCIAIAEGSGTDHTAGVTASGRVTAINDHRASGSQDVEQLQVTDQDLKSTAEDQDQAEDDLSDHPFPSGDEVAQDGETDDDEEYEELDPGDERPHRQWVSKSSWGKNASDPAAQSGLLDLEEVGAPGLMRRVAPHDPEVSNNASSLADLGSRDTRRRYSMTTCKTWGRRRNVEVWTSAHDAIHVETPEWANWRRRTTGTWLAEEYAPRPGRWRSDTDYGVESGTCLYYAEESQCTEKCDAVAACTGYDRYTPGASNLCSNCGGVIGYCCFKDTTLSHHTTQNGKNRRRRYSTTCDYSAVKKR